MVRGTIFRTQREQLCCDLEPDFCPFLIQDLDPEISTVFSPKFHLLWYRVRKYVSGSPGCNVLVYGGNLFSSRVDSGDSLFSPRQGISLCLHVGADGVDDFARVFGK